MPKLRIVIADDHTVLRSGLKMLLESQSDMEIVGEACDHHSAIQVVQECIPDVMTVDLSMPGGNGFDLLRKLKEASSTTRFVVLTMHDDLAYYRGAIAAGADGFVLKKAADLELMSAIRSSTKGPFYASPNWNEETQTVVSSDSLMQSLQQLSDREREVLAWVAQGMTNQEIADMLALSVKTVESYRARLMRKLKIHSRAEIVRFALQVGLLQPDLGTERE
jgi:two-component system, NarL family, response regulator NreC